MKIGNRFIGVKHKPFIVAELSGNHSGSLKNALKLIKLAKKSGADAVKIQTYTPDDITLDIKKPDFIIKNKFSPWNKKTLFKLYEKAHTPLEWHKEIYSYAKKQKIICFSSVFNERRVEFLEKIGCPAYKIASFENNHFPLIRTVLKTNKPVIVSTGMMNLTEIKKLISFLKKKRKKNLAILKCCSSYPSSLKEANIKTIQYLREKYKNIEIGLSDHSLGIAASCAAISLGASIIEKHLIIDKKSKAVDSSFSITPKQLKDLSKLSSEIHQSLGSKDFSQSLHEIKNKKLKRSIYVIKNINSGDKFSKNNIGIIRPGNGLNTEHYAKLLGKKSTKRLIKGTPFKLEYLKK